MAPVTSPFATINGSLPPLIPKPEDLLPPPPVAAMPEGSPGLQKVMQDTPRANVFGPTAKDTYEHRLDAKLGQDMGKDANPFGSADNHPGTWGKLLHGLSVLTGGPGRRAMEEEGLDTRLNALGKLNSEENLQGAQAGEQTAEAGKNTEETSEMPGKTASDEALQGATAGNLESETRDRDAATAMGPPLANAYAHRVNQILQAGGDPSTDPVAQHLADAITSIQKQPTDATGPKTIQKEVGGKPHTFAYSAGTKDYTQDEGETGEKPPVVRVETPGESRSARNDLLKAYQPTLDSAERMNVMTDAYEKAVKDHDQQAMLNLLANHLGMTMGLQKGARITRDLYQEAAQSTPWLQKVGAKFDKDGYLSGVTLNPQQMRQMVNLAQERYQEDAKKSRSTAQYLGSKDDGPERTPGKATINYYLGQANGDPNKAKQLAAADGWTVK